MPKIRLNKAAKRFNISIGRVVSFLEEKGIQVQDVNPNALLEEEAFSALETEFQKDSEQKQASHEVVISKVPEEKLEIEKEEPEIKRHKPAVAITKPEQETPAAPPVVPVVETPVEKPVAEVEKETPSEEPSEPGLTVLGKIDLSKIQDQTSRHSARKSGKKDDKKAEAPKEKKAAEKKEHKPKGAHQPEKKKPVEKEPETAPANEEPEKIETVYQKLEGPKILKTVDLSKFERPKKDSSHSDGNSGTKKRKRITKVRRTPGTPGQANTGNQSNFDRKKGGSRRGNPHHKAMPVELTDEQVKSQIKETLEKLTNKRGKSKGSKHRREKRSHRREEEEFQTAREGENKTLMVTEFITVNELAGLMNVNPTEVISSCFSLGVMVTMNQRLEADTLTLVADEFGYNIEFSDAEIDEASFEEEPDKPEDLQKRAPIVTVMGHVDHGKTSLLDYVRNTNVIAGESGGITQHIGAYNVKLKNGQNITFLDTPGHEAFTAMRARGAQITDIAIIVIAADDEVMPQTKEAIAHAQAAGVPMIIAINKVDKPHANPERIREQLSQMNILVEEWGGNVQSQEISAKFGTNVDLLLEKVLLQAEMLELKANPNKAATGVVIEAALDKGRGYVATVLVQNGTLHVGDYIVAGTHHGKIKAMLDERGKVLDAVTPSMPATLLGLNGAPTAGDKFRVFEDEKEAKNIANKREQLLREQNIRAKKHLTLDEIGRRIALGEFKELNIILKGDVDGSVEALSDQLEKLSTESIHISILHKGVGSITESDVLLASASDAIIIGFNVRAVGNVKDLAAKEEIEVRTYSVIYDAIDEVKEAMEGMLSPEIKEQIIGEVEVREVFKISKVGTIAGCMVLSGKVTRNSKLRVIRDGIVQFTGGLESLKRFKDDVKEVTKGYECGLNVKNYNDIQVGDTLEIYEEIAVKRTL